MAAARGFLRPVQDDVEVTTADSETILSFEVGYKALLERVRFNVAAFYYEIDDMQLVAVGGQSNSTALLNADEGVGYGIEFEFDGNIAARIEPVDTPLHEFVKAGGSAKCLTLRLDGEEAAGWKQN